MKLSPFNWFAIPRRKRRLISGAFTYLLITLLAVTAPAQGLLQQMAPELFQRGSQKNDGVGQQVPLAYGQSTYSAYGGQRPRAQRQSYFGQQAYPGYGAYPQYGVQPVYGAGPQAQQAAYQQAVYQQQAQAAFQQPEEAVYEQQAVFDQRTAQAQQAAFEQQMAFNPGTPVGPMGLDPFASGTPDQGDILSTSGGAADAFRNYYFWVRHIEGRQLGGTSPYTSFGGSYITYITDGILMFNGQFQVTNRGKPVGNVGAIVRYPTPYGVFGANAWYDVRSSRFGNTFHQAGVGFEYLTCGWSVRGNAYLPFTNKEFVTGGRVVGNPGSNQMSFYQNTMITGGQYFQTREYALKAFDVELARHLDFLYLPAVEAFAGYYTQWGHGLNANGAKGGVRGYILNNLSAEVTVAGDNVFGNSVFGGVTWFFGGPGGYNPCRNGCGTKLTVPVVRNQQISIYDEQRFGVEHKMMDNMHDMMNGGQNGGQAVTKNGDTIRLVHVDSNNAGAGNDDGTFESPFTSLNDISGTRPGDVIILHGGSMFNNESIVLQNNQQLIGEGQVDLNGTPCNAAIMTDNGFMPIPQSTPTAAMGPAPVITNDSNGTVVTVADNTVVAGVEIDGNGGGGTAIGDGGNGAMNVMIDCVNIHDFSANGGTGISIDPAMNVSITRFDMANNDTHIALGGKGITIGGPMGMGGTIMGGNTGIDLGDGTTGSIAGDVLLKGLDIDMVNDTAIMINNAQKDFRGTIMDVMIDAGGNGLKITNSKAGAEFNVMNLMIGSDVANLGTAARIGGTGVLIDEQTLLNPDDDGTGALYRFDGLQIFTNGGDGFVALASPMMPIDLFVDNPDNNKKSIIDVIKGNAVEIDGARGIFNFGRMGADDAAGPMDPDYISVLNGPGTAFSIINSDLDVDVKRLTVDGAGLSGMGDGIALVNNKNTIDFLDVNLMNINDRGIFVGNSDADITVGQLAIDGATTGIELVGQNGNTGSFLAATNSGVIDNVTGDAITITDFPEATIQNLDISAGSGHGIFIETTSDYIGDSLVTVQNNVINGDTDPAVEIFANGGTASTLKVNFENNDVTAYADAFVAKTGLAGGALELNMGENTFESLNGTAVNISAARTPSSVAVGANFLGTTLNDQPIGLMPPDTMGAVGPNYIVETINTTMTIFDKSGNLISRETLNDFFTAAGAPSPTTLFDPRAIYDPTTNRWFLTAINDGPGTNGEGNSIFIAVSNTEDPTDGFTAYEFVGDEAGGGARFNDYDTLAVDGESIIMATNNFSTGPVDVSIYTIPKRDLISGVGLANMSRFENLPLATYGDSIQGVVNLSGTSDGTSNLLATDGFGGGSQLNFTSIAGTGTASANILGTTDIPVTAYAPGPLGRQPAGATLDNVSPRFTGNVVEVDGNLYAVHAVDDSGVSAIRFYEIEKSTGNVLQDVTISDPNLDFLDPSVAVNENGDVIIGMTGSGPSQFASSMAVLGSTISGTTTFGTPFVTADGAGDYTGSRWGDYSATVVDPTDPSKFWTFQERVATAGTNWGVQITELNVTPGTGGGPITITRFENNTVLGTPDGDGGVVINGATFDADTATDGIQQVVGGSLNIGLPANAMDPVASPVHGDGLAIINPTGNIGFDQVNIVNQDGTGLLVHAKGPLFNLDIADSTIYTTGGPAMDLDPLSVNITASDVTSIGSGSFGVRFDRVDGTIDIANLTVTDAAGDGMYVNGGSAAIDVGLANILRVGDDGVDINNTDSNIQFTTLNVTNALDRGIQLSGMAGYTGSFSVTGDGATAGSGGTLQDIGHDGIAITNFYDASINYMDINAGSGNAVSIDVTTGYVGDSTVELANNTIMGDHGAAIDINQNGETSSLLDVTLANNVVRGSRSALDANTGGDGGQLVLNLSENTFSATDPGSVIGAQLVMRGDTFDRPWRLTNLSSATMLDELRLDIDPTGKFFNTTGGGSTPYTPVVPTDTEVGLATVNGNPVPTTVVNNTTVLYQTFDDFNPGELFQWLIDVDNTSAGGEPAPVAPAVVGAETVFGGGLAGTQVEARFADGTVLTGDLNSGGGGAIFNAKLLTAALNINGSAANSGQLTVTNFDSNVVEGADSGGGGVVFNTVVFDADLGTAGVQQVTGGDTVIGSDQDPVIGNGLTFDSTTGDIGFDSLEVHNISGTGLEVNANENFNLDIASSTIDSNNGQAVSLDSMTTRGLTFDSITSADSALNGIALNNVSALDPTNPAQNLTITEATISGAAANGLEIRNSSLDVNVGPLAVSNVGGDGVLISNHQGMLAFGNIDITNAGNSGLGLQNSVGDFTAGTLNVDGTDGDGVHVSNHEGMLAFTDINITDAGVSGLIVRNSSGDFTSDTLSVDTAGIGGIVIDNHQGDFTFTQVDVSGADGNGLIIQDSTTNFMADLMNISDIAQGGPAVGSAVFIDNTDGTFNVPELHISMVGNGQGVTGNDALSIQNSNLDASFDLLTVDQVDGDGVLLTNNNGDFTFAELYINGADNGVVASGQNGNTGSLTLATNMGTIDSIAGDGVSITNYPMATIENMEINAGSGHAVDIQVTPGFTGNSTVALLDNVINGDDSEAVNVIQDGETSSQLNLNIANNTIIARGLGSTGEALHIQTGTGNLNDNNGTAGTIVAAIDNNVFASHHARAVTIDGTLGGSSATEGGIIYITSFNDNQVLGTPDGDGGILINVATFDANPDDKEIQQVAGGTITIGDETNPVRGLGLTLQDVTGNLAFDDVQIHNILSGPQNPQRVLRTYSFLFSVAGDPGDQRVTSNSTLIPPNGIFDPAVPDDQLNQVFIQNLSSPGIFIDQVTWNIAPLGTRFDTQMGNPGDPDWLPFIPIPSTANPGNVQLSSVNGNFWDFNLPTDMQPIASAVAGTPPGSVGGGGVADGSPSITLGFNDFDPNETFNFIIDTVAQLSGDQFSGSRASVTFRDGTVLPFPVAGNNKPLREYPGAVDTAYLQDTFTELVSTVVSRAGLSVDTTGGLTDFNLEIATGDITTDGGEALSLNRISSDVTLDNVTSTNSQADGVVLTQIENSTTVAAGGYGVDINTVNVREAARDGVRLENSDADVRITTLNVTDAGSDGVQLLGEPGNTASFTVTGGTLDQIAGVGIRAVDFPEINVSGMTINSGGTGVSVGVTSLINSTLVLDNNIINADSGPGVTLSNTGNTIATLDATITNNTITASNNAFQASTGGNSGDINLNIDTNTLTSSNAAGINIDGSSGGDINITNFTDITVLGTQNGGGGILMDTVNFDAVPGDDNTDQVVASNIIIGDPTNRVTGDGIRLLDPTGDLQLDNPVIYNRNGTGLLVNTKISGTDFNLDIPGATVDTTGGAALFIDPLTTNGMVFNNVSSTDSPDDAVTFDSVSGPGTVTIENLMIIAAGNDGFVVQNSDVDITVDFMNINGAGNNGVTLTGLADNTGSVTIGDLAGAKGVIDNVQSDGIFISDFPEATIQNMEINAGTGSAVQIQTTPGFVGDSMVTLTNNMIFGDDDPAINIMANGETGSTLNVTMNGNVISSSNDALFATNSTGGATLELAIGQQAGAGNEFTSAQGAGVNVVGVAGGGTIYVTDLFNNVVHGSDEGAGGMLFNNVVFDADTSTTGIQTVAGGDTVIGDDDLSRVSGSGLALVDVSGDLDFNTLNIFNSGVGNGGGGVINPPPATPGLTFVIDFWEASQGANFADPFGNTIAPFDVTGFGFAATDFNLVANSVRNAVDNAYHNIPTMGSDARSPIPDNMELDVDFVIGDLNQPPSNGATEWYTFVVGSTPTPGAPLGVAFLNSARNSSGSPSGRPNGAHIGSIYSDNINGLGALTPADSDQSVLDPSGAIWDMAGGDFDLALQDALTSGNLGFTTNALAGTIAHEIGHTLSLLHLNNAGSVTPSGVPPIMGTGAIDLPNQARISPREFAYSGVNSQAGGATQMQIQQLVNAIGLRSADMGLDLPGTAGTNTGLLVDNSGQNFNLTVGAGSNIDAQAAPALALDEVNVDITLDSLTSTKSDGDAVTISDTTGTINITQADIETPTNDGMLIQNSDATVTVGTLNVTGAGTNGLELIGNTAGSGTFTASGGTIDEPGNNGIVIRNYSNATIDGMNINAGVGSGVLIETTAGYSGDSMVTLTNNEITGDNDPAVNVLSDGESGSMLDVDISGNTIAAHGLSSGAHALNVQSNPDGTGAAGPLTLRINGNTFSSDNGAGVNVDGTQGGSITVTDLDGNVVLGTSGGAGGILMNTVTFDSVVGNGMIDEVVVNSVVIGDATSRVTGDGIRLIDPTGALEFGGTFSIHNRNGTGLLVNTKLAGTDFNLDIPPAAIANIDTTNGAALFLDPLTTNGMEFDNLSSTNSVSNAATLDSVSGPGTVTIANATFTNPTDNGLLIQNSTADVVIGTMNITGSGGDGVEVNNSDSAVTVATLNVDGAAGNGVTLVGQAGTSGSFDINGGTLENILGAGISASGYPMLSIDGMTIENTANAIQIVTTGDVDTTATIGTDVGNMISKVGNGIVLSANGNALTTLNASIANNTIKADGLALGAGGDNGGAMELAIDNNTMTGVGTAITSTSAGGANIFLTGHDVLLHSGQNDFDTTILNYLRGSTPASAYSIAVVGSTPTSGWQFTEGTMTKSGYLSTTLYDTDDLISGTVPISDVLANDALVILSHTSVGGGSLDTAGSNYLNSQSAAIAAAFNGGMDIWGLSGGSLSTYYNFLPPGAVATGSSITGSTGFMVTPEGAAIGMTDVSGMSMINGFPTHNEFPTFDPIFTVFETRGAENVSIGAQDVAISGGGIITGGTTSSDSPAVFIDGSTAGIGKFTVTSFDSNTIDGAADGSGGVLMNTVTFDSDTSTNGIQQVTGGDTVIGSAADRVLGSGFNLIDVTGDLAFDSLKVFNDGGTGLGVDNTNAGTAFNLDIDTAGAGGSSIDTINGTAVNLNTLSTDIALDSVTSAAGDNGIVLDSLKSGSAFEVTGATMISDTAAAGISILNTRGAEIDFDDVTVDNLTGKTSGQGVDLIMNNTSNIDFNGDLVISTFGGSGLFAMQGGNVSVDGTTNVVTVDATGGAAVDITDTTVNNGAGGAISFDSLSSTDSTGFGVNLNDIHGDFTVIGDTTIANAAGNSVNIVNQDADVDVTFEDLQTTDRHAAGVFINDVAGSVNFGAGGNTTTIGTPAGGTDAGMIVQNSSGDINVDSALTIRDSGAEGILMQGNSGTIDFANATIVNAATDGVSAMDEDAAITFTELNVNGAGNNGITLVGQAGNTGSFTVTGTAMTAGSGGTIQSITNDGVSILNFPTASISNMVIKGGNNGVNVTLDDVVSSTVTFTNNDIRGNSGSGVDLNHNGNTVATLDATFTDNRIRGAGNAFDAATSTDSGDILLSITGTDPGDAQFTSSNGAGINIDGSATDAGEITITDFTNIMVHGTAGGNGGVLMNTVTFDSDLTMSGQQEVVSDLQVGTMNGRVQGDGVNLIDPSGALEFDELTVFNSNGTGLSVDTKVSGTTFNLDVAAGSTVNTTNGQAIYLDPLTTNGMTFDSVRSTNATVQRDVNGAVVLDANGNLIGGNGIELDQVEGDITFTSVTVLNAENNGVLVRNSDAAVTISQLNVNGVTGVEDPNNPGMLLGGHGISLVGRGSDTASFTLTGPDTNGNGDLDANEGSTIQGVAGDGINIRNYRLADISFTNINGASDGVDATTDSVHNSTVVLTDNNIRGDSGAGVDLNANGNTVTTLDVTLKENNVRGSRSALDAATGGDGGELELAVNNNNFTSTGGTIALDLLIDGDTFTQPFRLTNQSSALDLLSLRMDINPTGDIFDTSGGTAGAFNPLAPTDTEVGLTSANGDTTSPFTVPTDQTLLDLTFDDFNTGETFFWQIDVDTAPGDTMADDTVLGSALAPSNLMATFEGGVVFNPADFTATVTGNQTLFQASKSFAAVNIDGSATGAGPITVTEFSGNTVDAAAGGGGGILFDTVFFDADRDMAGVQQVDGGDTVIGTDANNPIQGAGLTYLSTTGNMGFDDLDILNNGGFGLVVDTDHGTPETTFNLDVDATDMSDATITTTNGGAMNLDPLSGTMNFNQITSTDATGDAIAIQGFTGDLTIETADITRAGDDGVDMNGSDGTVTFATLNVFGAGDNGVELTGGSGQSGEFNVTGDGATAGSGGTIDDVANNGISITNFHDADIQYMEINAGTGAGVLAETTAGYTSDSTVNLANNVINGDNNPAVDLIAGGETGSVLDATVTDNMITAQGASVTAHALNAVTLDDATHSGGPLWLTADGNELFSRNGDGAHIDGSDAGAGSLSVRSFEDNTVTGAGDDGVEFNTVLFDMDPTTPGTLETVTINNLNIDNTDDDGFVITGESEGVLNMDFSSGSGTIDDVDGDALVIDGNANADNDELQVDVDSIMIGTDPSLINGDGIFLDNVTFSLNNSTVDNATTTIEGGDSAVSGLNNSATPFSKVDNGGNTGTILFNGGLNTFP